MTINGPLDLDAWRQRLETDVAALRSVGSAADLATVKAGTRSTPQAFVVPIQDTPASSPGPGNSTVSQNVNATFAVVIAVSNQRGSSTGSRATEDLQAIRRSIMDSLIGWTPPGADHAIRYSGGRSLDFADSTVWWTDRFSTSYFVRKEYV